MKRTTLTPKLRFPEFIEDWKSVTVGDFFDLTDKAEKAETFDREKLLTVRLHANGVVKNEKTTLNGGANYFKRNAGQFIFSKIDLLNGAFGVVPDELDGFASSSDVPAFSFSNERSPSFFLNWLTSSYQRLNLERTGTSSTLKRIAPEVFLAAEISAPTKAEQQKIAECLSALDELIGTESQKLDALKAHKKGLMQQLFPREGEALPRVRFPEFQNDSGWDQRPLGKVCEVLNNRRKPITSSARSAGPYPYYGASGIVDYVDSFIFDEPLLLVGEDGAKWGAFERTAFVARGQYWVNNHAHVLRGISIGNDFLEYYLTKIDLTPFVTGAAPPKLTLGKLKDIPIPVPPSEREEHRIAACLSSLDDLIAAQSDQLEALKTHKKGLMQQLFPSPAEAGA